MTKHRLILLSSIVILMLYTPIAGASSKAPEWSVSEWINGGGVTLDELKGKVVIVEFFQLWCPGCNSFSIPLMKEWSRTFRNEIASLILYSGFISFSFIKVDNSVITNSLSSKFFRASFPNLIKGEETGVIISLI